MDGAQPAHPAAGPRPGGCAPRGRHHRHRAALELRLRGLRRSQIPADVSEPGSVLVSGRLLAEISRALPDKPVDVVLEGTKVIVTCGASRFTLLTMPVEDYPNLPVMPPDHGHGRRRRAHARGRAGVGRREPGRHVAAADGRARRDRGREGHAPGHRPLPPRAARADVEAVVARHLDGRAGPGPHAARRREVARQRRLGDGRARHGHRRRHDRLRGGRPADHEPAGRRRLPGGPPALPGRDAHPRRRRARTPWPMRRSA